MVTLTEIKEILGLDIGDSSEDHYLQNLIRRASFRISSACNRQLEFSELTEYFSGADSGSISKNQDRLYLKNWPVWEIKQLQRFNSITCTYEDIINGAGDTIADSVYLYEGKSAGLIRLLKNYTFCNSGSESTDSAAQDYSIRIKYRAGYKNFAGTGIISGKAGDTEISGDATLFRTELREGDRIAAGIYEYTVSEINSDTSLRVERNIEDLFKEESYRICNVPADIAEAVLMLAAGSYLMKKYEAYGMEQKTETILSVSYNNIKHIVESSNLTPNMKMRFREFDLVGVIESYRRLNI